MSLSNATTKKLNRERDERKALLRGLATSLFEYETIETTEPKAKALRPFAEKLITKAKKNDLHVRRQLIAALDTPDAAHKLIDEIVPKLGKRNSGYLRIERTRFRRGDNAQMARVSFVDKLDAPVAPPASTTKKKTSKTSTATSSKTTKEKK